MTTLHRSMFVGLSLLTACFVRNPQAENPDAGVYNGYYSEVSDPAGGDTGSAAGNGSTASNGGSKGPAKVYTSSTTRRGASAKGKVRKLSAKKPAVPGGEKPAPTTPTRDPVKKGAFEVDGVLPSAAAVGSTVEIFGAGLDDKSLMVAVGTTAQKIVERTPNRMLVEVKGGRRQAHRGPRRKVGSTLSRRSHWRWPADEL